MLKKTISYVDFNNNPRTEDFYFNLTKSECMKLEMGTTGGITNMIERIVAAQDIPTIIEVFEKFIFKAYGEKTPDGRGFVKSDALSVAFSQTRAYDKLFLELTSDAKIAAEFFNSVIENDEPTSAEVSSPAPVSIAKQ